MTTLTDIALAFVETLCRYAGVALTAIAIWLAILPEAVVVGMAMIVASVVAVRSVLEG